MASIAPSHLIGHLRRAALSRADGDLTDGQLLESFLTLGDEPAFAALVRRHGPMVLGVCRRVLQNHHDAEDAFQAAFCPSVSITVTGWVFRELLRRGSLSGS
jgi:hypothetical protein